MLFENTKEGDQVLIRKHVAIMTGGWGTQVQAPIFVSQPVLRTTATQITTAAGRFARRDGCQIAGDNRAYPVGHKVEEYGRPPEYLAATPIEEVTRLEYLRGALSELEKTLWQLERNQKPVLRALAVAGLTDSDGDVLALIQDATRETAALVKRGAKK